MNEKIIIKYLDELVNDFIRNPYDDFMVIEFLNESKRHLAERKDRAETSNLDDKILTFGLKKKLFKVVEGRILKLDEKGIELKDFGKGYLKFEKSLKSKPVDKYKIASIIISLFALYLGYLNYNLKRNDKATNDRVSELNIENVSLKKTIETYKDSINESKERLKSMKLKPSESTQ